MSRGSADGTNQDARFNQPAGVAVDSAGNVYVTDYWNNTIRKVAPVGTNWVVTTIGGLAGAVGWVDGTSSAARFGDVFGIAVDATGKIYVADSMVVRQGVPNGSLTNLSPVALCKSAIADATNGFAHGSVDNGSFDPDGDPITLTQLPPGPYPIGSNMVILTVTDSKGTSSQCLGAVTVRDPTPPTVGLTNLSGIRMIGHTGQVVVIQTSTNMVDWVTRTTNTLNSVPTVFTDADATNSALRFYRLRLWP